MSEMNTNDPLNRLAASDPAAGAGADEEAILAAVRERIAAGEQQGQKQSRRVPWLAVAAGVCALGLAAGSGFAVGRGSGTSVAAAPAISLNQSNSTAGQSTAGVAPAGGAAAGVAVGAPEMAGAPARAGASDSKMSSMPAFGQRAVYSAGSGIGSEAGSAHGYSYDASAVDAMAEAARLAKLLGIAGSPREVEGAMVMVGPSDGSGPTLSISPDGMRSFWSYDPRLQPVPCPDVPLPADGSKSPVPGPGCTSTPIPAAPSKKEAIADARDLMKAAGVDQGGFEWTATEAGAGFVYVIAAEVVDGQQTGATWGFTVTNGGKMAGVSGFLAPLVDLGTYPVVSPKDAVARLNDPAFGASYGGPIAYAAKGEAVAASGSDGSASSGSGTSTSIAVAPAPTPTIPSPMKPGAAFAWPVQKVTITQATLGLAQNYQPDGSVVLVPTYVLTGDDGGQRNVIAVADSALAKG